MRIVLAFHWPHDRCALGWEILYPNEEEKTTIVTIFLGIVTVELMF